MTKCRATERRPHADPPDSKTPAVPEGGGGRTGVSLGGSVGPSEPLNWKHPGGLGGLFSIRDASELRLADGSYFVAQAGGV